MLDDAVAYYAELGGKKDLSYLYEALGLSGGEQPQQEEAPTSGTTEDGIEWEISAAFKKRRKSKYNGKNVTGYDEGMFEMADGAAVASSRKVFSNILCSKLISEKEEGKEPEDTSLLAFIHALEDQGCEILDYGKVTQLKYNAYIKFTKPGDEYLTGIMYLEKPEVEGTPGAYKWNLPKDGEILEGEGKGSDTLSID